LKNGKKERRRRFSIPKSLINRVLTHPARLTPDPCPLTMPFPTEIFGNVIVVHTPKELGGEGCGALESFVPTLERPNVVLDMDATEIIDSRGLEALLNVQDKLRDSAGEAKIAATGAVNRKILEITRLDQQLEVFDGVVEAVKSFQ